jgi:hypothetical protein
MNSVDFIESYLDRVIYGWRVVGPDFDSDRTYVRFEPEKDPVCPVLWTDIIVEDGQEIDPQIGYQFPQDSLKELHFIMGFGHDFRWGMVFDTDDHHDPTLIRHGLDNNETPEEFRDEVRP